MNPKRLPLLIVILLGFTLLFSVFAASAADDREEAASALANAEDAVASAYNATLNVERAGANISRLEARLDDAGDELSKAEVAYRQGDYNSTINLADSCYLIAQGVKVEANQVLLEAFGPRYVDIWFRMVVSIFAVAGVGSSSLLVWRSFKRRYYQRVLGMKPEAVSHES